MSTLLDIGGVQVRPTHLHAINIGQAFICLDVGSGDYMVGSLLKVTPGYAKVSIIGETKEAFVKDKKRGGVRAFMATESYETEWSRGTMVYPVPEDKREVSVDKSDPAKVGDKGKDERVALPQAHQASPKRVKEVKVTDTVPVEIDKKGQPVPPAIPKVTQGRKPGGLKPSNVVPDTSDSKPEPVVKMTKEMIMAKVEKAKAKAALKGTSKGLKTAPKKEKTPKQPTNICPVTGELVFRRFKPGMDARYYGWLKKIVRGKMTTKELPEVTRKHLAKVDSSINRAIEKELTDHGVDVKALKEDAEA